MTATTHRILGIGAAHIDRRGKMTGQYRPGVSNPGHMREEAGGATLNGLRTMVQRGVQADIVSAIGGDAGAVAVEMTLGDFGIGNHCGVFLDRATASYTAFLDRNGDLIAGLADMDIHETALPRLLKRSSVAGLAAAADALLIDANIPQDAVGSAIALAKGKPVYAIAVSPSKVVRLRDAFDLLSCLFMNRSEAAALTGLPIEAEASAMAKVLRELGLRKGVITDGSSPLTAYEHGTMWILDPPRVETVADVTGAGDSFAGAAIASLINGKAMTEALREGVATSVCAISSPSAVPNLSEPLFEDTLAKLPQPRQTAF